MKTDLSCLDLCRNDFMNAILAMEDYDDSCSRLSASTIITLSLFLDKKYFLQSIDHVKCFVLRDDAGRFLKLLPRSSEYMEDFECIHINNLMDLEINCWPANKLIDKETLRKLIDFLRIRITEDNGLFNPAQADVLVYRDDYIIEIPPLTFLSMKDIEERVLIRERDLRMGGTGRIFVSGKDRLMIKDPRGIKIVLVGDFRGLKCLSIENRDICLGEDYLLYVDAFGRFVLKGSGYREILLRTNLRSSILSWSHPIGAAAGIYEKFIGRDLKCWWFDLSDLSNSVHVSIASHPYLEARIEKIDEIKLLLANGSFVVSIGASLEETSPWIYSQRLSDYIETNFVPVSRKPLISLAPNKILLHSINYDSVKNSINLHLVNHLPKNFSLTLITSGYFRGAEVSYIKNIWETLIPGFNIFRLTMPSYSLAVIRLLSKDLEN